MVDKEGKPGESLIDGQLPAEHGALPHKTCVVDLCSARLEAPPRCCSVVGVGLQVLVASVGVFGTSKLGLHVVK